MLGMFFKTILASVFEVRGFKTKFYKFINFNLNQMNRDFFLCACFIYCISRDLPYSVSHVTMSMTVSNFQCGNNIKYLHIKNIVTRQCEIMLLNIKLINYLIIFYFRY